MKKSNSFRVIPIEVQRKYGKFDLGREVFDSIRKVGEELHDQDIVVVSSKFASMSEGRIVDLRKINPSMKASSLAERYKLDPALAQLIIEESDIILGGTEGFALAIARGILAPNSGIDRSNVPRNYAILYPANPARTARSLRLYLERRNKKNLKHLGVVLSDSRITPTRLGTIGIAIATSGFKPVEDFRGRQDLFGNKLKVTVKAVADEISSAAQLVMGEADEAVPIVIVRGCNLDFNEKGSLSTLIPHEKCLYIQGLKNKYH